MASSQSLLFGALSTRLRPAVAANLTRFLSAPLFPRVYAARSMASTTEPFLKVKIQRDDTAFDAYVVGKENAPGIVVLQEWWGVDYEVKNHAQKIANLVPGYRALIPDLYRGKVALDVAEAQHLLDELDWPGAIKDVAASVKWLKANGSPKVGVVGFCMGGALSVASAVLVSEVDAAVSFYGSASTELADATKTKAPVQAHFGELDSFIGFSDVTAAKQLEEKLKASGAPSEVYIYPGIGHAFMNDTPDGKKRRQEMGINDDDPAAVELAWSRFSSWVSKYLSS
ncbi:uncharacterized protein LOC110038244 [Phalaenopsis equestris]|uniref:uncharacterized protein LOC110038244 n=1 Tax=Phalaenopsis equestris TaxID=78828 RepID=UPI0009E2570B|nr:uncharacterized protein LOC110038244 [Phalaenopsis equestris]